MRTPFNALYPVILTGIDTHKGIVIGAGNRSQDTAIVKTMSSALINRMFHVQLKPDPTQWLTWAYEAGIHPWVTSRQYFK